MHAMVGCGVANTMFATNRVLGEPLRIERRNAGPAQTLTVSTLDCGCQYWTYSRPDYLHGDKEYPCIRHQKKGTDR